MTDRSNIPSRRMHPVRATGTVAFLLLLAFIGVFIAFTFALFRGENGLVAAGLGAGAVLLFVLWARENDQVNTRAGGEHAPRPEIRSLRRLPLQIALLLLYVLTLNVSASLDPQSPAGLRSAMQALPSGLLVGWVAVFAYSIAKSDEMVRRVETIAVAIGAGATLLAATIWGQVATHTGAPDFATVFLFPAFAVFYWLALASVSRRFT